MPAIRYDQNIAFVTGANRGIGAAIVRALLAQKIKKVYAAARNPKELPDFGDARVVPVALDITNTDQVKKAAALAKDVQILINNAGVLAFAPVVGGSADDLARDMQVNYFGTLKMVNSFAPVIAKNGGGVIANVSSIVGLASMASIGGYSASKAALHSATQAMRSELKAQNITVHGIYPGPIDTDMAKSFDMQKTSAQETANNILAGIAAGKEEIFPDSLSAEWGATWAKNPKELEKQFAAV